MSATKAVLGSRQRGEYGPATIMASKAVLKVFPDFFSLWNVRREALGPDLEQGGAEAVRSIAEELQLVKECLAEHPKSYSAWNYRRWVVGKGITSLEEELTAVTECASKSMPCYTDHPERPTAHAVNTMLNLPCFQCSTHRSHCMGSRRSMKRVL
jgi:hypothetical protein